MPHADPAVYAEYQHRYYLSHKALVHARAAAWAKRNRERRNALRKLYYLRTLDNPTLLHMRMMADICAKYPKRRISYRD